MSQLSMPSSYYYTIVAFAIFFSSLNIFILTEWLDHPLKSPIWLAVAIIGFVALIFSWRLVKKQQMELMMKKKEEARE
ncbi:MAG: hypothetical protein GF411_13610 [Candidatus Lokiarchaeota archaeon]|nr:hypothetical protein [Candidatus Lokiarchaeota archaeon]